ncbi:MAG: hypothetical protein CL916_07285 [Deltaproteobacteria bacterium]|nr:hypothetical protein [Deltaproteobacteria bacterium]
MVLVQAPHICTNAKNINTKRFSMIYTIIDIRVQESNELVLLFLIASYTYYECSRSIMSNDSFDYLVSRLRNEWNEITHTHKHLIKEENLMTDSGYNIAFPPDIIQEAKDLIKEFPQ